VSAPPADAETFLALTDSVSALEPEVSLLEAGLLAALGLGLAADSRSFARIFGVAHALVLRAMVAASGESGLLAVTAREPRTQRVHYRASEAGLALLGRAGR
jgi:hypothetical protein